MKHPVKIIFLLSCILLSACKKYEDGPSFSLMTKKARLANVWQVDKYLLNGEDKTEAYRTLITREKLVIYQSGKFDYSEVSTWLWAAPEYSGTWNFIDKKESVELKPDIAGMK